MRGTLYRSLVLASVLAAAVAAASVFAENVDPGNVNAQYAWGENVGWINAEPNHASNPGAHVSGTDVTGYMWGENIGWINLNCKNNQPTCAATGNYGVKNDGLGNLSGYAWGENVGWISFSCLNNPTQPGGCSGAGNYKVVIDPLTGNWSGHAWGENIGWINFQHNQTASRIKSDDGDGVAGGSDNCPFDAPGSQTNTDAANPGLGLPGNDAFGDVCDIDDDGDGCADVEETAAAANPSFGGDRNPLNPWDFFEVTDDQAIDLSDTLAVLATFGLLPNSPGYTARHDRAAPNPAKQYQTGPATGNNIGIDLNDALLTLASFGHSCAAAP